MLRETMNHEDRRHVVFVDGVCVLCHGITKFLLKIDHDKVLSFSTLQGQTAQEAFPGTVQQENLTALYSVLYVRNFGTPDQRIYERSSAALLALRDVGGFWHLISWLRIVPRPLRDIAYDFIAKSRYRWFGKHQDACPLPAQEDVDRYLP